MFKPLFGRITTDKKFLYVFIAGLFLAFHYYLVVYINSTLLQEFISNKWIGAVYIVGAIIHILVLLKITRITKRIGTYHLMLFLALIETALLSILAFANSPTIVLTAFILHHAFNPILLLSLNVCLEDQTPFKDVGKTRGLFLTILAIASVIAPMFAGTLFDAQNGLRPVYLVSSFFMVLFFLTILTNFKNTSYGLYKTISTKTAFKELLANKNITLISIAGILLQLMFSWLIIYLPIFLHKEIGFSLTDIGILISITLLPFLLLELPVGELADKKYGEKEFLIGGMLTSAAAFLLFNFTDSHSIIIWGILILIARTGASVMETSIETYFYKKAKGHDELISIFSLGSPIAYIIGPLIGSVTLLIIPFKYMFVVLSIILFLGSILMLKLKDTK